MTEQSNDQSIIDCQEQSQLNTEPQEHVSTKTNVNEEESLVKDNFTASGRQKRGLNCVECPVCGKFTEKRRIEDHVNRCLDTDSQEESPTKELTPQIKQNPEPKRVPLAKKVYSLLKEKDLRQILKDLGLSTTGNKKQLEKRHKEYVLLYNAECDALNPRPVHVLVNEIRRMERFWDHDRQNYQDRGENIETYSKLI